MHIEHRYYGLDTGWDRPLPAELDGPRTLVLAFGNRSLLERPSALQALSQAFAASVVAGCSGAGEIASGRVRDGGLSVTVVRFDATRLHRAATRLVDTADSHAAGVRLAAQLPVPDLRAVLLLSPGVGVNGAALVAGLTAGLPASVVVSGGLAGDDSRFERTWVLDEREPNERAVVAVGLYGDALRVGHGCRGGWLDFGPERTITRSDGPVLFELDGQPALALYRHYLGDLAAALPGSALLFPLSLRSAPGHPHQVVRTILGIDETAQSLTFAGDMPQGASVRLMRTHIDRLVASAEDAVDDALQGLGLPKVAPNQEPVLALTVSCIGRRLVMGGRTDEEVESVIGRLPAGSMQTGFYSYGEVAPTRDHWADLHNQTLTLTLLAEARSVSGPHHG